MAFHRVAAYAPPGVTALGLGIAHAVFGPRPGIEAFGTDGFGTTGFGTTAFGTTAFDTTGFDSGGFDFAVCARRPGALRTDLGLPLTVRHGLGLLARAELILILPGVEYQVGATDPLLPALRAAHDRGAIIAAHCVAAFALGAAGLLDGLRVTTHWQFADELAARHPGVDVQPEALYVDEGGIVTGAGAAAGLDMCLHVVRREHGAARANAIARALVVPPHRDGGQAQYVSAPVAADGDDGRLTEVLAWARAHLNQPISVDTLAARALMSRRSFTRHFRAATGTSPHAWLRDQRLSRAEELLEATTLPVEQVAEQAGYRNAAALREQFIARRGVAPTTYRRTFSRPAGDVGGVTSLPATVTGAAT
jgi:transcriptional regulator GlxA family with amidase domain